MFYSKINKFNIDCRQKAKPNKNFKYSTLNYQKKKKKKKLNEFLEFPEE